MDYSSDDYDFYYKFDTSAANSSDQQRSEAGSTSLESEKESTSLENVPHDVSCDRRTEPDWLCDSSSLSDSIDGIFYWHIPEMFNDKTLDEDDNMDDYISPYHLYSSAPKNNPTHLSVESPNHHGNQNSPSHSPNDLHSPKTTSHSTHVSPITGSPRSVARLIQEFERNQNRSDSILHYHSDGLVFNPCGWSPLHDFTLRSLGLVYTVTFVDFSGSVSCVYAYISSIQLLSLHYHPTFFPQFPHERWSMLTLWYHICLPCPFALVVSAV